MDRKALVDEMLDHWELTWTDDIIARVERSSEDARARLGELFGLAPSSENFTVEMALRDWARRDPAIAERLRRVDNRRMGYLRALFRQISADDDEAEARSMLAYSLVIGSYFIAADHGERTRAQVLTLAAARLLRDTRD